MANQDITSNYLRDTRTTNYLYYLLDQEYKEFSNLTNHVEECLRFYDGEQWPLHNEDNMIRVTENIISYSTTFKASKINGTPQYLVFTSDNGTDCTALQRFDEYNLKKLKERTFNFQTLIDSLNVGTAITYLRWDEDDTSYKGIYKGGLVQEQIDILRFAVANPYIKNLQNQKWIMFWYKAEVGAVRDLIKRDDKELEKELKRRIKPDDEGAELKSSSKLNQFNSSNVNHGLVTVYVRFFRINGEVFHTISTQNVDIYEYPKALNPYANKSLKSEVEKRVKKLNDQLENGFESEDDIPSYFKINDLEIDYEDMINQITDHKDFGDEDYRKTKEKFNLYPFARLVLYEINGSFYGRSDVKNLISIQKAINFSISMGLKCIENNAYNKIFVKEGALDGQTITNEPGQVLVDKTKMTNGWGIKFAESQPIPNGVYDFTNRLIDTTRVFNGFNQVMDGTVTNQNISGYALQQQIKQSNAPIEQQQQIFWSYLQDKAAIRLMFYKFYVDEATFTYELDDSEVQAREVARKRLKNKKEQQGNLLVGDIDVDTPVKKTQVSTITGNQLLGTNFDINIDVQQGMLNSELSEAQVWDTLIINGGIQNLKPDMLELYLHANPVISQATKDKLKHIVEKQKQEEIAILNQQVQQLTTKLQEIGQYALALQKQYDFNEQYTKNLQKEFTDKINVSNEIIKRLTNEKQNKNSSLNTVTPASATGVTEGEAKSNNARGIEGSNIV